MQLNLILALFVPLLLGPLVALLGARPGRVIGWVALIFPVLSFSSLLHLAIGLESGSSTVVEWAWIPSMGISLAFLVDGLSLLFGLIVSGIGILVVLYAIGYFNGDEPGLNRFYAYIVLFMATMLGTVLSDNLLLTFIFWEGTGITSFMLIGFLHHKESSRAGARMALLITVFTGLFMLAGIIMVQILGGHLSISRLLAEGLALPVDGLLFNAVLVLLLLGAFGKSAQFPFHFWLPRAMEAPTPVSAYLHSATMVKLGVFMVARIYPAFHEALLWGPILMLFGFGTMALAAFLALRSNKLKAILAVSTVTQLGALIGFYGLQSHFGVFADYLHILDHVLYKACLFMVAGIVTHSTGLTDIRELGGLARRMPLTALAAAIACASMAGLPLTMGFLSKELLLADFRKILETGDPFGAIAFALFFFASVCKFAFTARFFFSIFRGPLSPKAEAHFHAPSTFLQGAPLFLALLSLASGLLTILPETVIRQLAVDGLQTRELKYLTHWHGLNAELMTSLLSFVLGWFLFRYGQRSQWRWTFVPRLLRFDEAFEQFLVSFNAFTVTLTKALRSERPTSYLPILIFSFASVLGGFLLFEFTWLEDPFELMGAHFDPITLRGFIALLIMLSVAGVVLQRAWTGQLIFLSTAGFLITFYFVLYQAPDLALTQILVESATLLLVLLLLSRFARSAQTGQESIFNFKPRTLFNLLLSASIGVIVTITILIANVHPPMHRVGSDVLLVTVPLAEGSNAVNTILVDFRGFDTMGEIAVLVIAVLGSLGLYFRYKRPESERRQRALGAPGFGIFHKDPGPQKEVGP